VKKFDIFLIGVLCALVPAHAQDWIPLDSTGKNGTEIKLIGSNDTEIIVGFSIHAYALNAVQSPSASSVRPAIADATPLLKKGAPNLCRLAKSIVIPDKDEMQAEVISSDFTEINDVDVAPSKGSFSRKIKPESVPFSYNETYRTNSFFPGKLVELGDAFILRDFRGQTIYTYPLQYNPVTKTLRIYKSITVKITSKNGSGGANQILRDKKPGYIDREFDQTYRSHFLNYQPPPQMNMNQQYTPLGEKGRMLVISRADCIAAMQPLVAWKKLKGIQTDIVSIATVGNTTSAIAAYIKNYYAANPTLKFLLLVGDYEDIPSPIEDEAVVTGDNYKNPGACDIFYGYLAGNDHYAEVFVGRFSCATVADAQTQVDRTITYERDLKTTDTWLNKTAVLANDGTDKNYNGDNDVQHIRKRIEPYLTSTAYNGSPLYAPVAEFFGGTQGAPDAAGDPNLTFVNDTINTGRGTIAMSGDGGGTGISLGNVSYTTKNASALANVNELPHIWSLACSVGQFNGETCLAEAFMRAQSGGKPAGAITAYMASCQQIWDPPYAGQIEIYSILTGQQLSTNYKITAGGLAYNGCVKMIEQFPSASDGGTFTADTWTLFGDPSVVLHTTNLSPMTITHAATVLPGATSFAVSCNVTGALVSLTQGGEIVATAYSAAGANTIPISPALPAAPDTMKVTVTAQNRVTYLGYALISPSTGINNVTINKNRQKANCCIFTARGEKVSVAEITNGHPLHLKSGIYFEEIETGTSAYMKKFIVAK
jgi:hypothetical protein